MLCDCPSREKLCLAVSILTKDTIFYPKSHLIYSGEGVGTYLQSDFSYTCTAVAAWRWDEEWVLITGGGGGDEMEDTEEQREGKTANILTTL